LLSLDPKDSGNHERANCPTMNHHLSVLSPEVFHTMAKASIRAKPELVCPVGFCEGSPLLAGRVDWSAVAPGYSHSGFAVVVMCLLRFSDYPIMADKWEGNSGGSRTILGSRANEYAADTGHPLLRQMVRGGLLLCGRKRPSRHADPAAAVSTPSASRRRIFTTSSVLAHIVRLSRPRPMRTDLGRHGISHLRQAAKARRGFLPGR
jgi:hypothetical protein